jgi:response regulator RpfG family c-di-GMP phosphodiesterase
MTLDVVERRPELGHSSQRVSKLDGLQAHLGPREPGTRRRILVVDDEPLNLNLMRQILKDGYDLAFAKSGPDALQALRLKAADLILLDVMMPGMDGYQVCAALKAVRRRSSTSTSSRG